MQRSEILWGQLCTGPSPTHHRRYRRYSDFRRVGNFNYFFVIFNSYHWHKWCNLTPTLLYVFVVRANITVIKNNSTNPWNMHMFSFCTEANHSINLTVRNYPKGNQEQNLLALHNWWRLLERKGNWKVPSRLLGMHCLITERHKPRQAPWIL